MYRILVAIFISGGAVLPANAYFWTGNELLDACRKKLEFAEGLCVGDVAATFDAMSALGYECRNVSKVTRQQVRDVVIRYLEQHPEHRHMPAAYQSIVAIELAFNCQRK